MGILIRIYTKDKSETPEQMAIKALREIRPGWVPDEPWPEEVGDRFAAGFAGEDGHSYGMFAGPVFTEGEILEYIPPRIPGNSRKAFIVRYRSDGDGMVEETHVWSSKKDCWISLL